MDSLIQSVINFFGFDLFETVVTFPQLVNVTFRCFIGLFIITLFFKCVFYLIKRV